MPISEIRKLPIPLTKKLVNILQYKVRTYKAENPYERTGDELFHQEKSVIDRLVRAEKALQEDSENNENYFHGENSEMLKLNIDPMKENEELEGLAKIRNIITNRDNENNMDDDLGGTGRYENMGLANTIPFHMTIEVYIYIYII